jgi:hypothetical protein
MSDPDLVAWEGPDSPGGGGPLGGDDPGDPGPVGLAPGQSADFWFATAPTGLGYTNGVVGNPSITTLDAMPAGFLAVPIAAAPVPQQIVKPLVVATAEDKDNPGWGLTSLREAMFDVIDGIAPGGTHQIVFTKPDMTNKTITLSSQLPTINTSMYIYGTDSNGVNLNITITRDATQGAFRLFNVSADGNDIVSISGLTLTGGAVGGTQEGGAIKSWGKLTLTSCTIRNNQAFVGGGIAAAGGTLDIVNCQIDHNTAAVGGGGAGGGISISPDVTAANITSSTIHDNTASIQGGGIYIDGGLNLTVNLVNDLIYLNLARVVGGGVAVQIGAASSAELTLVGDTEIYGNWATGTDSRGGGVYLGAGTLTAAGNVLIGYPLITDNYAASGGGIYKEAGATLNQDGMTVTGNLADDFGGPP